MNEIVWTEKINEMRRDNPMRQGKKATKRKSKWERGEG